jgi:hypothetical protein
MGVPSSPRTSPPRNTQVAWSHPEEKLHRPLNVKPPSTGFARPMGAYDEETLVSSSSPHTSRWARSSNSPSCHGWHPSTEATHPVDPHALEISRTAR